MRKHRKWFLICCVMSALAFLLLHRKMDGDLIFMEGTRPDHHASEVFHELMTDKEADMPFIQFLSRRHVTCKKRMRLGNIKDGGWDMCIAEPYRPQQPCLVYSFGINNDFSFDDAVNMTFGCTVRSFDPSMNTTDYQRSDNEWFYRIGIGGKDELNSAGWKIKTLSSLVAQFNDSNRIIDYLKMDVEESEYSSLEQMLSSGILSQVKQLALELHVEYEWIRKVTMSLYERYRLLKRLEDAGFRRWYYLPNMYNIRPNSSGLKSCCYQMVYINKNFLTGSIFTVGKAM